jgi:hypothetical protein
MSEKPDAWRRLRRGGLVLAGLGWLAIGGVSIVLSLLIVIRGKPWARGIYAEHAGAHFWGGLGACVIAYFLLVGIRHRAADWRRVGARVGLLVFSIAFTALLLELGLRVVYYTDFKRGGDLHQRLERSQKTALGSREGSFNMSGLVEPSPYKDVIYKLKPDLRGAFRNKRVSTNSHGMRGPEIPVEKAPGVFRIIGIGDSVMFGWGVADEVYYLRVLEAQLNARNDGRRYECLNLAVPGYNTTMEVAALENVGMDFEPDLVVLQFINNDFGMPLFLERQRTGLSLKTFYLKDLINLRLSWLRGDAAETMVSSKLEGLTGEERDRSSDPYRYMLGESGFTLAMERLARLTGHRPPAEGEEARRPIPVIILRGTLFDRQRALMDRLAPELGFEILDIAPVTQAWLTANGYPDDPVARERAVIIGPGDRHPNAIGHQIYADGLMEKMRAMGL